MAVGFPAKVTYANGNVFSASDINDTNGTINLINPSAKGDLFAGSAANTYTKLSVGANNTVLIADSTTATGLKWGTPTSGGMTLLSTTTLSSTTVISSINQTYRNLFLIISGISTNAGVGAVTITPNSLATSTDYTGVYRGNAASGTASKIDLGVDNFAASNTSNVFQLTIANYAQSTSKPLSWSGRFAAGAGATVTPIVFGGAIMSSAAITSLTFANSAGSFNAGTVLVFGVN